MKTKFAFYLFVALTIFVHTASAQQVHPCNEKKSYWTFDKLGSTFLVKLNGKVTPTQTPKVISVSNYTLQYVVVKRENYMNDLEAKDSASFGPLVNYATSEGKYLSGVFQTHLELHMDNKSVGKRKILLWYFQLPVSAGGDVKFQLFANTIIGDKIVGLSSSQFSDQKFEDVQDFLINELATLKEVKGDIDFDKLCGQ